MGETLVAGYACASAMLQDVTGWDLPLQRLWLLEHLLLLVLVLRWGQMVIMYPGRGATHADGGCSTGRQGLRRGRAGMR